MRESLRKSGIDIIGDVPWGTHFCQFYQTKEDLADILVPYFKEGLENNEFCIWVTSQSLEAEAAKEALRRAVLDLDTYLEKGQIEIIPHTCWYLKDGIFDSERVLSSWVEKFNSGLNSSYDGVRISGDISWLEEENWDHFAEYKKQIDNVIVNCRIIALCTCPLDRCSAAEIIDLAVNHQFALIRRKGEWEQIESSRRKKVEELAFRTVKDWEETFDAVLDLVTIIDNKYRIVRANRAMAARLGVTPEKCIGLTCYHAVHGTNEPPSFCPHKQLLKDGLEHTVEIQEDILGGFFSVSVSPLYDAAGELIGCIHIARDITDRKHIEESLRESEAKYRNIIETANEGIWIIDNEDRTTYVNKKMAEMLGYSPEEMIGRSGWDFTDEKDEATIKLNIEKRQQGIDESHEFKFIRKDGSPLWALVNIRSFFDKDGKFTGSMGMLTDITERKRREAMREAIGSINQIIHSTLDFDEIMQKSVSEASKVIGNETAAISLREGSRWIVRYVYGFPEKAIGAEMNDEEELHAVLAIKTRKPVAIDNAFNDERVNRNHMKKWGVRSVLVVPLVSKDEVIGVIFFNYHRFNFAFDNIHIDFAAQLAASISLSLENSRLFDNLKIELTERKQKEHRISRYNNVLAGINRIFSNAVQAKTEEELGEACLSVALEVTGSQFGFINEIGSDGMLHDIAKSQLGWEQCLMYDKTGHRRPPSDFVLHGLYGSVIINEKSFFTNDPQSHPESIGLPQGHPPITSFLGVPLVQDGKITGVIAVANREGGYISEQQEDLEAIAPAVTQALRRERSEEALRFSNIYNRSLIEASLDPLVTIGPDGRITDVNGATEQVTGYSRSELIGTDFSDYFTEPEKARAGYRQVFINGQVRDYPLEVQHKDGRIISVMYNASVYKDEAGKVIGVFAAARDITELKKAEEELKFANKYNRSLIESSLDPLVTIGPDGKITDVNNSTEAVTGRSRYELIGTDFSDYFTEPEKAKEGYQRAFKEGLVRDYSLVIQRKDGHITPVLYNASVYRDESGEIIGVFAAARDITERKKTEEKIQILANAVESSDDAIITKSLDGIILSWNRGAEKVYGYSAEEVLGKNISILEPENFKGQIKHFSEKIKQGEKVQHYETSRLRKDGTIVSVSVTLSPVFDTSGELVAVSTVARDITEHKKAQEAVKKAYDNLEMLVKERTVELEKAYESLKESEEGLAEAQRMAHIGNWDWDLVTDRMRWSNELYHIFGRSPQKSAPLINEFLNYIHPDDRDYVDKSIEKGLKEKSKNGIDYRIILANGEERTVHSQAEVIFDQQNIPVRVKGIVQDITERKKTEEKIQVLVNAVESSNDAILTLSFEGIILSWNKGAEQIYGYSAEEIVGKNISITEPDNLKGEIKYFSEKIKQGEKSQSYETLRLRKDGTTINISAALSPVFNASGELVAILAIARDITERIKTEEAMAEIDKIRIKEIHHRIKNNLQVISSLLDLQAERFRNKEVLEAFRESQNRVTSMSLIHEELYKSEGKDTLNFSAYLQKLAESLFQTYSLSSKNVCLFMDLEENTFFDMDIAVPLGIIVNELVSNSLKHAFAEGEEGEIRVRLYREEENDKMQESLFSLTISDNGKGIPENIDLESLESLGLQLVDALVDQLDGNMEIKRGKGTEFRITFKVAEK